MKKRNGMKNVRTKTKKKGIREDAEENDRGELRRKKRKERKKRREEGGVETLVGVLRDFSFYLQLIKKEVNRVHVSVLNVHDHKMDDQPITSHETKERSPNYQDHKRREWSASYRS